MWPYVQFTLIIIIDGNPLETSCHLIIFLNLTSTIIETV